MVSHRDRGSDTPGVSRRAVMMGALLGTGATIVMSSGVAGAFPRIAARRMTPVVALHADRLYVDHSGTVEGFEHPAGARSLDGFDEEALRRLSYNC